jgi:hypothetical protein
MRTITNEAKIRRGARLGKIGTLLGLGFLVVGLIISLTLQQSPLLWVSFLCLLLGLLISTVGTMNMNRWVREPRADQALEQGLKGFDNRYRLYNYLLPAPHVLLSPAGLWVLTAMGQDGVIRYDGNRFHRNFSVGRVLRFMADEGLGRPFAEADGQVNAMTKYLDQHDVGQGIEIQNVVVFYNPRAQLDVTDPPRPLVAPKALKKAIRKQQETALPEEQYQRLKALFEGDGDR